MQIKTILSTLLAITLATLLSTTSNASIIYLSPSSSSVDLAAGTTSLDLFMDFTADSTVGGGIDIAAGGSVSFLGFTPSTYFNSLDTATDDSDFTGYGTAKADNDFEIHFGDFDGVSGVNQLGTIMLSLDGLGLGNVDLSINSFWGDFYSATTFDVQTVDLLSATVNVTAVPVPAALWLFISGLGLLGLRVKK